MTNEFPPLVALGESLQTEIENLVATVRQYEQTLPGVGWLMFYPG